MVFRPSLYDRAPEFQLAPDGISEVVRDDCMEFLARHARHRLETLRPTTMQTFHTGALWDTNAPTYWEVSNGERTHVVEGRRAQIGSPLCYRLRAGRVVAERLAVEVSEVEVRRQIDAALYPGVAPERKLAAFTESFKRLVWDTDSDAFELLYDVPGDPTLAVAKLPSFALAALCDHARRIFDADDSGKIIASFAGNDEDPDGFTVLVRQRVRVEG